ncbi:MAG: PBP1A family penicillin-binding protein [Syntrophomonas sp.]
MSNGTRKTRKKGHKVNSQQLFKYIGLIMLIGLGTVIGTLVYTSMNLPAWDPQQLTGASSTTLYDDKGEVCASLHAGENRTEVELDKVPQDLINAFIAIEDQDFYEHHGVNYKGIIRAVLSNVRSGDLTGQGASTITQQLARNAFLTADKRVERKLKEIVLAYKLESNFSKDEILTMYMNKIYFGGGAYGVQAASKTFFGKDVSELTLEESSLLAGLVQSPNNYYPFQYFDRAKARQKMVLDNMVNCGFIDEKAAQTAFEKPLHFQKIHNAGTKYGFFTDAVIEEALDILGNIDDYRDDPSSALYRSGLKIYTTMNSKLQEHAEELAANPANFPSESKNGQKIQVGMTIVDDKKGEVKAVLGGRQYEQQRGFNRAIDAHRQPGSSIKPLSVYGPALEQGFMPYYTLEDKPLSYKYGGTIWKPENYDLKYRGLIPMRTAVQYSINTYAVQMLDQIGIKSGYKFAQSLGLELVDTKGTNDLGLAPLSLGGLTKGATPLQMAAAYGAFGNSGVFVKPHFITRIVDADGVELYNFKPAYRRVMSEETSWLMTSMLQTVVNSGTGTKAKIPGIMCAGKTGTSEEYRDSWFCGYVPGFSGAVWMGYDQEYTMHDIYGGGYPALLWKSMMQQAIKLKKASPQAKPSDIIQISICTKSGKLMSESCPQDQVRSEYCVKEFAPKETCDIHQMV